MPTGVYIRNPKLEAKRIASIIKNLKGKPQSEEWKAKRMGKGNPCWRGGQTKHKYNCEYCGVKFIKICCPKRPVYKYCSLSCASKGVERTKEWYDKVSKSLKDRFIREGLELSEYVNFTRQLKERVRVRDNFICQQCGIPELEFKWRLDVHHVDYNKGNFKESNLISLCKSCHSKTNFDRAYWTEYFKAKLEVRV